MLDDYQGGAAGWADWDSLGDGTGVTFLRAPIAPADLPRELAEFDVLVAMRERTRFPRTVLERLPRLRLLVTTGMRNAALDLDCLRERG
ncbi:MAG: D-2-hydroxyacid dehydrogenase family protein, partial [Trebonia sp.]